MAKFTKVTSDCDLTENMFAMACGTLASFPEDVTLYCSAFYAAEAQKLRDTYRCAVVMLPAELLVTSDAWAVGLNGEEFIWSPGA